MRLVSFVVPDGYRGLGYLAGEQVIDFTRAFGMYLIAAGFSPVPATLPMEELLAEGLFDAGLFRGVVEFVEQRGLRGDLRVERPRLLPPFRPKRLFAVGRNYAAHAAETGHKPPKEPVFFLKASTSVIGPDEPVVCPKGAGRIDHEVELAVIIGKRGKHISRAKAMEYVAGYSLLNDVTARDMQARDLAQAHPWFLSKSFDTFGPFGPCLALPDEIPDPHALTLSLTVNGEVRQHSNTGQLIHRLPDLIHHLSRYLTLEPGDVIATGTPEGISPIYPGDVMEASVQGIGVLRNPVVAGR